MFFNGNNILALAGKAIVLGKWIFTGQPTSAAIDITHRCNLKCRHCYFWREEHSGELSDVEMTSMMKSLKARGLRAVIIYGGEPTLRPGICHAACEIFDACLIFTNGTNGFPYLNRGKWIVSLDGPEKVNDEIRGDGVYTRAISGIKSAKRPPIVHMTISRLNMKFLDHFVSEMMELPIEGIGFSFFTPSLDGDDSVCALSLEERDLLVLELLDLRRRFGPRVGITAAMARQFLAEGDFFAWNKKEMCPVSKRVLCFGPEGRRKMCTYGDRADCSRCGCAAVAAYRGAFFPFDFRTLLLIFGLMGLPGKRLLWPFLKTESVKPIKRTE